MKFITVAFAALVVTTASSPAYGYHGAKSFELSANAGGGGGIFFTGAERWKRYDCAICHVGANGGVSVALTSSPPELLAHGEWQPNRTYEIVVEMLGESRGFQSGANINTFVGEVTGSDGQPRGSFDFDASELATWNGGHVIGARGNPGRTRWSFQFTAPPAGSGRLALDIAMVDGNGANVAPGRASDLLGDGVATAHRVLCEAGIPCRATAPASHAQDDAAVSGCNTSRGGPGALVVALALLLLAYRRQAGGQPGAHASVPPYKR